MVHNYTQHTKIRYTTKQKQAIQEEYTKTVKKKQYYRPAPAIITHKSGNDYIGIDINNTAKMKWQTAELPVKQKKTIIQHFEHQHTLNIRP